MLCLQLDVTTLLQTQIWTSLHQPQVHALIQALASCLDRRPLLKVTIIVSKYACTFHKIWVVYFNITCGSWWGLIGIFLEKTPKADLVCAILYLCTYD